jgi:hypothetical protein
MDIGLKFNNTIGQKFPSFADERNIIHSEITNLDASLELSARGNNRNNSR